MSTIELRLSTCLAAFTTTLGELGIEVAAAVKAIAEAEAARDQAAAERDAALAALAAETVRYDELAAVSAATEAKLKDTIERQNERIAAAEAERDTAIRERDLANLATAAAQARAIAAEQAYADALVTIRTLQAELDALKPAPSPAPTPVPAPPPILWNNTATRDYFDGVLQRRWRNPNVGDWVDGDGVEQGAQPFAWSAPVKAVGEIRIPVGELRDLYIAGSRYIDVTAGLKLEVAGVVHGAVAETHIAPSTAYPLSDATTRKGNMLARFAAPAGAATLVLTVAKIWSGGSGQVFKVFAPAPRLTAVTRPAWVKPDPTVLLDVAPLGTKTLAPDQLTWFSKLVAIPPSEVAFATVFLKLHDDFAPGDEGKLPGLSNTGQATRDAVQTGWGGRRPDGIHWSARSGYGKWDDEGVALRTYFYAMAPSNLHGLIDPTGRALPKGRWAAYVQGVRLNTPGVGDGGLFYWLAGHGDAYADDIRWRDSGAPESLIREMWIDFYCGGTANGGEPSTVSVGAVTVTRGLPDLAAIEAEVARLNASGK